jgi:cell division protein FtsW (lipid II flippase)
MKEILYTLIFTAVLLAGVYMYAVYATSKGITEDENQNYNPDSWEKNFKWLFSGKVIIMFVLGLAIGYLLGTV